MRVLFGTQDMVEKTASKWHPSIGIKIAPIMTLVLIKPGTAGVNFHTAVNIRTKLNFVGFPKQIRDKTDRVNKAKNKKKTK